MASYKCSLKIIKERKGRKDKKLRKKEQQQIEKRNMVDINLTIAITL
jgi:hypothetical protein